MGPLWSRPSSPVAQRKATIAPMNTDALWTSGHGRNTSLLVKPLQKSFTNKPVLFVYNSIAIAGFRKELNTNICFTMVLLKLITSVKCQKNISLRFFVRLARAFLRDKFFHTLLSMAYFVHNVTTFYKTTAVL